MSEVRLNFLNWRPDQDELNTEGLQVADNVIHETEGYKEVRGPATATPVMSSTFEAAWLGIDPLGGVSSAQSDQDYLGIAHFNSGTPVRVNLGTFNTWSEYIATAPAGATAGALQAFSSVELEDTIVACGKFYFATASPTTTTIASGYITYSGTYGAGSTWTDLPNSAVGTVCGKIGNFVLVGNDGTGNPGNQTLRWSAIGDATDWPTPATDDARSKQAGQQILDAQFGQITAIVGGDFFGYVFQENAITKVTYVGGDIVFTFDTFEEQRGCGYFNRTVTVDDTTFFESVPGRHALANGQISDLGFGLVDNTYPPDTAEGIRLYKNPHASLIFFSNGVVFNYRTRQFTRVPALTPTFSIEDSTGIIGQFITQSGFTRLLTSTGGAKQSATITTGDSDLNTHGRTFVKGVRPLADGGTWTMRVGTRPDLSTAISWSSGTTITDRTGYADFREEGRYVRFEFANSDGFTTAMGADIEFEPAGRN